MEDGGMGEWRKGEDGSRGRVVVLTAAGRAV